MMIFLLNLVGLIFPVLLIATIHGNNNIRILILSASGLFISICLKNYGYINELQLDYVSAIMVVIFSVVSASYSNNKRLIGKKIPAFYPDQATYKVLPMKYHLCKWLSAYFLFLAVFAGGAVIVIYLGGVFDGMQNNMNQIINHSDGQMSIISGVNNQIGMVYLILTAVSGLFGYGLHRARKNMLPVFWRLQLAPLFNPEHENIKSIEEITDKEHLKKILEVNSVILIENTFIERQGLWNDALSHVRTNYSLTVDAIITRPYLAGTTIGGLYEDGEYKLYFIKLQHINDDKTPPAEIKKDEVKSEKLNEGVAANAI